MDKSFAVKERRQNGVNAPHLSVIRSNLPESRAVKAPFYWPAGESEPLLPHPAAAPTTMKRSSCLTVAEGVSSARVSSSPSRSSRAAASGAVPCGSASCTMPLAPRNCCQPSHAGAPLHGLATPAMLGPGPAPACCCCPVGPGSSEAVLASAPHSERSGWECVLEEARAVAMREIMGELAVTSDMVVGCARCAHDDNGRSCRSCCSEPIASARHVAARCHHRGCLRGLRQSHQGTLMGAREQRCCSTLEHRCHKKTNVAIWRGPLQPHSVEITPKGMIKSLHSPIHSSCGPITGTQALAEWLPLTARLWVLLLYQFTGYHQDIHVHCFPPCWYQSVMRCLRSSLGVSAGLLTLLSPPGNSVFPMSSLHASKGAARRAHLISYDDDACSASTCPSSRKGHCRWANLLSFY